MKRLFLGSVLLLLSFAGIAAPPEPDAKKQPADVVARVDDQTITFSQINTMLNSSAIVGLSIPELGSPERDQVRLTLLDKIISANLIYLDALRKGADKDPEYQRDLKRFSDSMLAALYKKKLLTANADVTEEDVKAFFDKNIAPGTEFTDEVRVSIRAKLRKERQASQTAALRNPLREGRSVEIHLAELDPGEDTLRDDSDVVAELDGTRITWGEVKPSLSRPFNSLSVERRVKALDEIIDTRIVTQRSREAGIEKDLVYQARFNEFKKVRLINRHRATLVEKMKPSDEEVHDYYKQHRGEIMVPERRKVQIVVLETKEEAEAVKEMIKAGTITIYQAANQHSIVPGSQKTLGEIGWVSKGTGFAELDKLTFSLEPDMIGGPVETPNGWHLVKVQDIEDAVYDDIDDPRTRKMTRRRLIKERLNDYVVSLRKKDFPVEVYDDRLSYHMQKEVDWYKIKRETGEQPPEKIYEEIEKLRN